MNFKNVIGLPIAATDYAGAVHWILEKASLADRAYAVEAANTHVASLARSDPEFGASMAKFDLITPDGMPLVWSVNAQLPPSEFPNSLITGVHSPPFGAWPADETETIIGKIRASGANLVWVGLGCPKQEHWIAKNKHLLPPAVYFGIGAAFAFHAGEVKQAPALFQKTGLEWAYRLAMEPRRLFKRYLTYNSLFLYHTLRGKF